jgi:DNA polymerase delta subunit 1
VKQCAAEKFLRFPRRLPQRPNRKKKPTTTTTTASIATLTMDADGTPFRDEDYGENDYDSESDASANVDDAASDAGSVSSAASDSGSDGSESSEDADGDKKMMPLVDNDDDDVDLWDSDDEAWGVKSDPFYTWRDCVLGPLMDSLGPVNAAAMTEREALAKDMAYLSEDFQRYLYDSTRRNELRDVAHWDELHKGSSGGTEDNVAYTMMINDADADTIGDRCFVRLYGTTKHGHSVMATLENYRPYFYADMPGGRTALNPRELLLLQNELNYALQAANIKKGDVVQIEQVAKKTTDGYEGPVDPKELGADVAFPLKPEQIPPRPMLRIFCKTTKGIKTLRTAIEQGKVVGSSFYGRGVTTPTYESNIPYLLRVLIDRKIAGGSWVSFPRQYVRNMLVQGTGWDHKMQSRCQVELFIDAERMVAHDYNDAAWGGIAPFRIMSYDIEVNNDNDRFPTPYDADALARTGKYTGGQEVIMIANEGWHFGQDVNKDQRVFRCLLMQRTCDRKLVFDRKTGRPEDVFFFCNEKSLLLAWRVLVHVFDPDMFTGYNIVNFDTPYMINRPKALDPNAKPQQQQQQPWNGSANVNALNSSSYKMRFLSDRSAVIGIDDRFCRGLGRLKRHYVTIKEKSFSSKARGTVKRREASLHGLVQYDMYSYVTREKKYASYKLGYVANKIIGETKDGK